MTPEEGHAHLKKVRETCLANAEALISVAEREFGMGVNHISFHLALLALEEVGKSILATIDHMTTVAEKPKEELSAALDDHAKKIFWAIWGGGMLRKSEFNSKNIQENQRLANTLHERRLESLYTDARNPLPIEDRVPDEEARMILGLVRSRLNMERAHELAEFEGDDLETITWFFAAIDDIDKRKQIFSRSSLDKLAEVQNGKDWIKWLRELYGKNEAEMREYAEKELRRAKPEGEDQFTPKYRMRIRIQTTSHSIRNNAFAKWNEGVNDIKIYKSDRKDVTRLTKGEIFIDFTLPKGLHANHIWEHGFYMSKTVVIALNAATFGVFWWNAQKDIAKFYDEILDLEADPNGGIGLEVGPHKRLHVDFDPARLVLNEQAMSNVYMMVAFFFQESAKLEAFLKGYALALTMFSKTDIHLPLEVNSFGEFYGALKAAMLSLGDWDGKSDFKQAVTVQFAHISKDMKDLEKILDIGHALEADHDRKKHHPITLTEVVAIKIYCDYYMQLKAKEHFAKKNPEKENKE